jgi:hypothetical protein
MSFFPRRTRPLPAAGDVGPVVRTRTPLQTRVFGTTAAVLVVGALVWGGPAPRAEADEGPAGPHEATTTTTPVAVPLQATVVRDRTGPRPRVRVPDPDHIGPCPKKHSPVIWQGMEDGRPTWRHRDGSVTQRVRQKLTTQAGEVLEVPAIVSVRPAAEVTDSR